MNRVIIGMFCVIVLTQSLIDLELGVQLGGWYANAPIVDIAGLLLCVLVCIDWYRSHKAQAHSPQSPPLPGRNGYLMFLAVCLISLTTSFVPGESLHFIARKPVFLFVAYGWALPLIVSRLPGSELVTKPLMLWMGATSSLSILTSASRWMSGGGLWFASISGITPNHKSLAVSIAGALPLILVLLTNEYRKSHPSRFKWGVLVTSLALLAIGLSFSKTAWITTAVAIGLFVPRKRPWSLRPMLLATGLVMAMALAYYAPLLSGSRTMLDAARSRHSLNRRAEIMVRAHPLVGYGAGTNTVYEMVTFPHYRVNGIDAHGVVQKVVSETGIVGLVGFGWFSMATGAALRRRWTSRLEPNERAGWFDLPAPHDLTSAATATWITLHVNLLLSTETFSPTHWVPLGICWGLAHRPSNDLSGERTS